MMPATVTSRALDAVKDNTAICTYTGRAFDVLNPDGWSFRIVDIAQSLSNICRFGGHVYKYNVADHSVRVMQRAIEDDRGPVFQTAALMHDAAEAYLGDIPSPIKHLMSINGEPFADVENRVLEAICNQLFPTIGWGVFEWMTEVKQYDYEQYLAERDQRPWIPHAMNEAEAYDAFMHHYVRLCKLIGEKPQ